MANKLPKPIVIRILPFDPNENYKIEFLYTGNQIIKNYVVIKDINTNEIAYEKTISTSKLEHEIVANIPENKLVAGNQYTVQVQVFDENNDSSMLSDPILFYCLTKPSFSFYNDITHGEVYKNASIELKLEYSQPEGENIRSYQFMQYSEDKILISSSDGEYVTDKSSYTHTFYNLDNNSAYYFRAIGETVNGIVLDTDFVRVDVVYKTKPANLIFDVTNEYCKGYITLNSNIKTIEYEFENEDNYLLENGMLKLWDNSLTYKSFKADGDFALFVEARKLPVKEFFKTNDNNLSLSIINICGVYYCKLNVKDTDLSLFVCLPKARLSTDNGDLLVTNDEKIIEIISTSYNDDELIVFEVKRVNNLYSIKAYYKNEYLS